MVQSLPERSAISWGRSPRRPNAQFRAARPCQIRVPGTPESTQQNDRRSHIERHPFYDRVEANFLAQQAGADSQPGTGRLKVFSMRVFTIGDIPFIKVNYS